MPPPPPPTAAVELKDIEQSVRAIGIVQPSHKVEVGARVTGQVRAVHVKLNQSVHKNDLLVTLDSELARSEIQQVQFAVGSQAADVAGKRVELAQAQWELARQQRMAAGDATTGSELHKAETEVERLEAAQRSAAATLGKLQADLTKARVSLEFSSVRAPADGDVVSIAVQEGQTVNAQQQSPTLLTIATLDPVTIKTQVAESDIGKVHRDQDARFTTFGNASREYHGKVSEVQPLSEKVNNAVFYNVLFGIDNTDRSLMADMSVDVSFIGAGVRQTLSIPVSALGDRAADGTYSVQVLTGKGQPSARRVHVGISDAAHVQVLGGLKLGERVVLAPVSTDGATPK